MNTFPNRTCGNNCPIFLPDFAIVKKMILGELRKRMLILHLPRGEIPPSKGKTLNILPLEVLHFLPGQHW